MTIFYMCIYSMCICIYMYVSVYIYILHTKRVLKGQAPQYYKSLSCRGNVNFSFLPACINFLQHKHTTSVIRSIF